MAALLYYCIMYRGAAAVREVEAILNFVTITSDNCDKLRPASTQPPTSSRNKEDHLFATFVVHWFFPSRVHKLNKMLKVTRINLCWTEAVLYFYKKV